MPGARLNPERAWGWLPADKSFLETFHEPIRQWVHYALPHPDPLPLGEGTAIGRALVNS